MSAATVRSTALAAVVSALLCSFLVGAMPASAASSDPTPPTQPTNLRVTSASSTSISLRWNESVDNVRVTGYVVFDGLKRLNEKIIGQSRVPEFIATGLACGTSYTFGVEARDRAGNASERTVVTASTAACGDRVAPSAPTSLRQTVKTATSAVLQWKPSIDNVGVVGYGVYVAGLRVMSTTDASATITGLRCGSNYQYGVDAVDAQGNRSAATAIVVSTSSCADAEAPSAPSAVSVSNVSSTGFTLGWRASTDNVGVAGYRISVGGVVKGTTTSTSYGVTGLTCGASYTVVVDAYDAAGNRSAPASTSTSTARCDSGVADTTPPTSPSDLKVMSSSQTGVSLAWLPSVDNVQVAGYGVYRNGQSATTATSTSAAVGGLSCGTAYTLAVDSYDPAGNRSAKTEVVASTGACADTQAPQQPTGLTVVSRTASSVTLAWAAATDNVGVVGYGAYVSGARTATTAQTTHVFGGLTCGTSYTLGIDAADAAGNRSPASSTLVTTTACPDTTAPSVPSGLVVSEITGTSAKLTWQPSSDNTGVTGYIVSKAGVQLGQTAGLTYPIAGLQCNTQYNLGVAAVDGAGNVSPVAPAVMTTAACEPPTTTGPAYYVATTGSDSADGSQSRPWRTLAKACSSVPGGAGATINVAAGTYVETAGCNVPPLTSIVGAGGRNGLTVIRGSADSLISVLNATGASNVQTIRGLKLDGQNKTAGRVGLRVDNVRGLVVRDIWSEGFRGTAAGGALDVNRVWNADVGFSTFRNSGAIFTDFASGTLGIRNAYDSVFHDLDVYDASALAVKGGYTNDTLRNVEFYNLTCTVGSPTILKWPAISFEMNEMDVVNVTIRNSAFNATLSVVDQQSSSVLSSGFRYDIHHNRFDIPPSSQTGHLQYALELEQNSSRVHHNYFNGGVGPIAHFSDDAKRNLTITHNVFDNQESAGSGLVVRFPRGLFSSKVEYNTVVVRDNGSRIPLFTFGSTTADPAIGRNLFVSLQSVGDIFGNDSASASVDANLFFRITSRGTNAAVADPRLPLTGGFPAAYVPPSDSAARTYGAFANGAWSTVGPT